MQLLKFGDYVVEEVTEYEVEVSDADAPSSGRSESGIMHRDRVRGGSDAIYKLTVACTNINDAARENILKAVEAESVQVTFYFGKYITKEMYANNRKIKMKAGKEGDVRWDVSFSMIEY